MAAELDIEAVPTRPPFDQLSSRISPPHFEIRTLVRSAVPRLDGSVGVAAERLVEHDGQSQARADLRLNIDLGMGHRL